MSTSNLLDVAAELGSEEDDEDFNEDGEEGGSNNKKDGNKFDDSSEEEDEDEDEAAAEEVRRGFIVDEDEDDEEAEARAERRRERKKRRREEREEEEGLDDEDLDLIGELDTEKPQQSKFKRLKQGHRERERGIDEIFDDDDDDDRFAGRGAVEDELDDFIEEDELDDDERRRELEEIEVSRKPHKGLAGLGNLEAQGLDPAAWEDITAAFGVGEDYDWALDMQIQADQNGETMDGDGVKLADVFEPSQLAEKMLTDEDLIVKSTDIPERYQVWRKDLPDILSEAEDQSAALKAEAEWITIYLWPKKAQASQFGPDLKEPFTAAIAKVLDFACLQNFEVPFIFAHRKDYLIHREKVGDVDVDSYTQGVKLLNQTDLWSIIEYDLKYRTLAEKRKTLRSIYDKVKEFAGISDSAIDDRLDACETNEEVQDVQDYFNFRYSAEIADLKSMDSGEQNGLKRARGSNAIFEGVRAGPCYNVVRGFGISTDDFAKSASDDNIPAIVDDPAEKPEDLAAKNTDDRHKTGESVLKMAKVMFVEELALNPRMRTYMRGIYFAKGYFDCIRTEKGLRKIDEDHAYYDLKYARHQTFRISLTQPQLILKMLKAQSEGFIDLKLRLEGQDSLRKSLYRKLKSDNFSEAADAWNALRKEVLDLALDRLHVIMTRSVIETLRTDCEARLAESCREEFSHRLDQAPYRPQHSDMDPGQAPRVLALTNGRGSPNKEDVFWCYLEEDGRILEQGRLKDLRLGVAEKALPDGEGVRTLVEIVNRRKPDVIGVSGFSVETRMLYKDLQEIVKQYDLRGQDYDGDNGPRTTDALEVVLVNDEVARLYYQSNRAAADYPTFPPLIRYTIAIAKYMQNPLIEYASLGKDINAISFHQDQSLIPSEKLTRYLETALVDMVNLVGVEIHEALRNKRTANLLKYVCGLGPRKAQGLVDTINRYYGGEITLRDDLIVSEEESGRPAPLTVSVWQNCASFIFFEFDATDPQANYLDNTRIHPEDYDLARKIASDALELDEEDVRAEEEEYGKYAIVRKLVRDEASEKVNDLELEEYATQLQDHFNTRKRATLETIRNELMSAFEELRHDFMVRLRAEQMFTMLTGETQETLHANMLVPIAIRKIFPDHIEGRLDCGLEVGINAENYPAGIGPDGINPRDAYHPGQVIQGKIMFINHGQLSAQASLKENDIKMRFREANDREPGEWDFEQEDDDRKELRKRAETTTGRSQRVIKHPLFRAANSKEAENILAGQSRGDCVIRPGSKGSDHLAITWKVSDGVFQHIDVLELDKENEFSVGRILKIGGKYTYSDLDELIELHVKAMARKVDEIMNDERYQRGTKAETEAWLAAYTEANPTRSMYAFCIDKQYPGYFCLCFKAGRDAKQQAWPIKVIPNAFELMKNPYPDMRSLKNGFKTVYTTMAARKGQGHAGVPGPGAAIGAPMNGRPMPVRRY